MTAKEKQLLVSSFSLFSKSYDLVVRNWQKFAVLSILPFIGLILSTKTNNYEYDKLPQFSGNTIIAVIIFGTIFILATFIVRFMTTVLELEAAQEKTPSFKHLWDVTKKYWLRLIGLYIMIALMVIGGLLLLIVPGFIMIRRYYLAPYVMINEDLSISESMKKSAELSKPYSGFVWGIIGVSIILSIPGIIPRVGAYIAFILAIFYSVAPPLRYLELKKFP